MKITNFWFPFWPDVESTEEVNKREKIEKKINDDKKK